MRPFTPKSHIAVTNNNNNTNNYGSTMSLDASAANTNAHASQHDSQPTTSTATTMTSLNTTQRTSSQDSNNENTNQNTRSTQRDITDDDNTNMSQQTVDDMTITGKNSNNNSNNNNDNYNNNNTNNNINNMSIMDEEEEDANALDVSKPSKSDVATARRQVDVTYIHRLLLITHFTSFGSPLSRQQLHSSFRARLYAAVSCSSVFGGSPIWSLIMSALIITSFICILIQSFPQYRRPLNRISSVDHQGNTIMSLIQLTVVIAFTIEYIIRICTVDAYVRVQQIEQNVPYSSRASLLYIWFKFSTRFLNIIDLAAIIPYYFVIFGFSNDSLAILRLVRIFRLLLQVEYFHIYTARPIIMFITVITNSVDILSLMIVYLLVGMIFFGTIIFYCEQGEYDHDTDQFMRYTVTGDLDESKEVSPFYSIPQSFYWVVVTMSTVGYGDLYPTSTAGKVMTSICIIFGLILIAMPISIIGANFTNLYAEEKLLINKKSLEIQRKRRLRQQNQEESDNDSNGSFVIAKKIMKRVKSTFKTVQKTVSKVGSRISTGHHKHDDHHDHEHRQHHHHHHEKNINGKSSSHEQEPQQTSSSPTPSPSPSPPATASLVVTSASPRLSAPIRAQSDVTPHSYSFDGIDDSKTQGELVNHRQRRQSSTATTSYLTLPS